MLILVHCEMSQFIGRRSADKCRLIVQASELDRMDHHETTFCSEIEALLMSGRSNLSNLSGRARMLRMLGCSGRSGIARSDKSHCDKPVKKFRQVRCRIATCLVTSSLVSSATSVVTPRLPSACHQPCHLANVQTPASASKPTCL